MLLCGAIVWLTVGFRRDRMQHEVKAAGLRSDMLQINMTGERQKGKLLVSVDMERKIMAVKQQLDQELLLLQHDLIGTLAKNKLVE